jgi:hypothetical protein
MPLQATVAVLSGGSSNVSLSVVSALSLYIGAVGHVTDRRRADHRNLQYHLDSYRGIRS